MGSSLTSRAFSRRMSGRRCGVRVPSCAGGANALARRYLYGLTSLIANNYFKTSGAGGEPGSTAGFGVAVLWRAHSLSTTNNALITHCAPAGTQGYQLRHDGSTAINFIAAVSGSQISAPKRTLVASDVGRLFLSVAFIDSTGLRLYVDRAQVGSGTAASAANYNPYTGTTEVGGWSANPSVFPAPDVEIFSWLSFVGQPSDTQIKALYDQVRNAGDLPTSIAGVTVTHRQSLRDQLIGLNAQSGDAAPSTLTDTITSAVADALSRQGAPTITRLDPSIDGRTAYGAQGFSAANRLQTSGGFGATSNTPFWGSWCGTLTSLGADKALVSRRIDSTHGWMLYQSAANTLIFYAVDGSGTQKSATPWTIPTSVLGIPLALLFEHTGSQLRVYAQGTQQGADVAITGLTAAAVTFEVNSYNGGLIPNTDARWFGSAGGATTSGLTPSQVTKFFADFDATGRVPTIAGVTDHLWDPTQDVIASGDLTRVPAVVKDRIGTDDLTNVGIAVHTDANGIRGIGPCGAADGWQTAPGGGIRGAASAANIELDVYFVKVPTATETLAHCANSTPNAGWHVKASSASLQVLFGTGSAMVASSTYTLTSGDLNKRTRITGGLTGSNTIQLWINGTQVGTDVSLGGTYSPAPSTAAMVVGQFYGAQNFTSGYVEALQGGSASITPSNVATLNADLTVAMPSLGGTLTQKRYVFDSDISLAGGKLPGQSIEQISGGDSLVRFGSPLTLAVRTDRVWSWETAPIYRDLSSLTLTDFYSVAGGWDWTAAGGGLGFQLTVQSQTVASGTRVRVSKRDATTPGYQVTLSGTNQLLSFTVGSSSNSTTTTSASISASDVGKRINVFCWFDGSKAHLMIKRAEVGSGSSALSGIYASSTAPFCIGKRGDNTLAADGIAVGGFVGIVGVPSLAELYSLDDMLRARESMQSIPGREGALYDPTVDAAGSNTPIVSIRERIAGVQNLSASGSPTQTQQYARAAA